MQITAEILERLEAEARRVSKNAYAPYSRFRVGTALVNENGTIFSGANVENASYGLTVCAERNAVFSSVAAGNRKIAAIVIYTPTDKPTLPCGACRQVISEFSRDTKILSICDTDERIESSISNLFPNAFGPNNLRK